ncbi:NACHT domain-containing protein [Methylobacterium sp. J-092]|uniref:NACHT domain-containing protein n=1 Tax=Methylobacterium sp. J-092 TaxID=2836667 RepID=UPI001FBB7C5E|nr:hypothetical protein [Methylobacterium sp. J-092]MCJ2008680.1 hypothetical protein [Methylobacterium sp. J-092]
MFEKLNAYGRFVLIFDGFDEMKHGMTVRGFEKQVSDFLKLDKANSRIIILGRDTAFHSEVEFRSIIEGKKRTLGGAQADDLTRRAFRPIVIQGFTLKEAHHYISNYFPIAVENASHRSGKSFDPSWIADRKKELVSGSVDELLDRPVHAQMLCEIATDQNISLDHISRFKLYDKFIHHLINREVQKKGRSQNFDVEHRRVFNSSLAWWLWENGGASTTTFANIPDDLCSKSVDKAPHDYDEIALRRELVAGCLVSKGGDAIYFSHRSIQEFLVAEHLITTNFFLSNFRSDGNERNAIFLIANLLTPEIVDFLVSGFLNRNVSQEDMNDLFVRITQLSPNADISLIFLDFCTKLLCAARVGLDPWSSPWSFLIENFVRVGRAEFRIPNGDLKNATELFIAGTRRDINKASMAIMYWARCLRRDIGNANKLTAVLLASMISPGALEAGLKAINGRQAGTSGQYVVEYRLQPLLWLFLNVVKIESPQDGEIRAKLDIIKIINWSRLQCGLKVPDEILSGVVQTFRSISYCSLSDICESLADIKYTVGDISTVRRYFTNTEFQKRVRPSNIRVGGIN